MQILDRATSGLVGSFVALKGPSCFKDLETKKIAKDMIDTYGRGPFQVRSEPKRGRVVLMWTEQHHAEGKPGETVRFVGALADIALDAKFVESWKWW